MSYRDQGFCLSARAIWPPSLTRVRTSCTFVRRHLFWLPSWLSVAMTVGSLVVCASKLNANQVDAAGTKTYIAVFHFRFCGCGVLVETKDDKVAAATGDSSYAWADSGDEGGRRPSGGARPAAPWGLPVS